MKKITYSALSLILLIIINGCTGYEPIFDTSGLQFKIVDYSIEGDRILGQKIYSRLYRLSKSGKSDQNLRSLEFVIKTSKDKKVTAKDSAGKILEYNIILNTDLKVTDIVTKDRILDQVFISSLTYKVQNNYSDTVSLENSTVENLLNKTYQDLLTRLAQNIITK